MPNYNNHVDNYARRRQGLEPVKRKKISVAIRSDVLEQLDAHAESKIPGGLSRSAVIERAVQKYLREQ